jgi:hypothetical protein
LPSWRRLRHAGAQRRAEAKNEEARGAAVDMDLTTKNTKITKSVVAVCPTESLQVKLKKFETGATRRSHFLLGGLCVLGG